MRLTFPLLVVVLTILSTPAAAQSGPPGQCDCAPAAPWGNPEVAEPWQAQRWGIGLRVGAAGIDDRDAGTKQNFTTGGVSARYRWSRRFELELAVDHGTQQLEDGSEGAVELNAATLSLLIHLRPQSSWDWYLLGGIGGGDRRLIGAPDSEADARGHIALGAGLEKRFEHLVLGFDVRVLGIAVAEPLKQAPTAARVSSDGTTQDGSGGGQVTFTAGWYF
jgi:Outer membrane protein beta-barrel domain